MKMVARERLLLNHSEVSKKRKSATLYMYVCICMATFQRKNILQDHILVYHEKMASLCNLQQQIWGRNLLKRHLRQHNGSGPKYCCALCNYRTEDIYTFKTTGRRFMGELKKILTWIVLFAKNNYKQQVVGETCGQFWSKENSLM